MGRPFYVPVFGGFMTCKTEIQCCRRSCLNNSKGFCSANKIHIGGTGTCKCFVAAKHVMNRSKYGTQRR
jgi:hypothetical protein|nr:MAG TPA: protein of Unknown Function (DUF1540) [Caudoviricetes sp.]